MAVILSVEDDKGTQTLLERILTPQYQVVQAFNPADAIEMAQLTPPDLILLDLTLQRPYDGLEVCRTLRGELEPGLAHVPVLALTGELTGAAIKAILAAGVNGYISKPYDIEALLKIIDSLLANIDI